MRSGGRKLSLRSLARRRELTDGHLRVRGIRPRETKQSTEWIETGAPRRRRLIESNDGSRVPSIQSSPVDSQDPRGFRLVAVGSFQDFFNVPELDLFERHPIVCGFFDQGRPYIGVVVMLPARVLHRVRNSQVGSLDRSG